MTDGMWSRNEKKYTPTPKVEAFITDLTAVSRQHGFIVLPEDLQGGFIIEKLEGYGDTITGASLGKTLSGGDV